jgi:polyhydroxybutyrate depolymerase
MAVAIVTAAPPNQQRDTAQSDALAPALGATAAVDVHRLQDFLVSRVQHEEQVVWVDGIARSYLIGAGTEHDPVAHDEPLALVLVLHPTGGRPEGMVRRGFSEMAVAHDAEGAGRFLVVYPRGLADAQGVTTWNPQLVAERADDSTFFRELLADLQREHAIDPARIYVVGFSVGAAMTYRLACDYSDQVAAIGVVAPAMAPFLTAEQCAATRPVPVLHLHGTEDEAYERAPAMVAFWQARNGCAPEPDIWLLENHGQMVQRDAYRNCHANADVVFYRLVEGHHVWPGDPTPGSGLPASLGVDATALIWEFFLTHLMPGDA